MRITMTSEDNRLNQTSLSTNSDSNSLFNDKQSNKTQDFYSILLPTYNERENIAYIVSLIIETFTKIQEQFEIVIIDDGSPDGTLQIAYQLQSAFGSKQIVICSRESKLGLGSAYKYGIQHAHGNFIIIMDADFSHHPKYIPDMIQLQREFNLDVVSGCRYKNKSNGGVCGWNLKRKLVSRCANLLAKWILRPGVEDLTGSFRLYRRSVFDSIMKKVVSTGYVFQMEIIVRAQRMGYSIGEIPITFVDRLFGDSKLGSIEIVQYALGLALLFWST